MSVLKSTDEMQPSKHSERRMRDIAEYSFIRDLDNLGVLKARYFEHRFTRHYHEEFAIGLVEVGSFDYFSAEQPATTVAAGSLMFVNPGVAHAGWATDRDGWGCRMIYPSMSLVKSLLEDDDGPCEGEPALPQTVQSDPEAFQKFVAMHKALRNANTSLLEKESLLVGVSNLLFQRYGGHKSKANARQAAKKSIDRAADYISEYAHKNISLTELSKVAGVSRFHLCRSFKRQYGVSTHAFQIQCRIKAAMSQMRKGVTLPEVALNVGFFDQSHFGRHFKRIMGVSPGRYIAA